MSTNTRKYKSCPSPPRQPRHIRKVTPFICGHQTECIPYLYMMCKEKQKDKRFVAKVAPVITRIEE